MKVKNSDLDKIYSYVVFEYKDNDLKFKGKHLFYHNEKYNYAISLNKENDNYEILPIIDLNEIILKITSNDIINYKFIVDAYKEKIHFLDEDIIDIKTTLSEIIPIYEQFTNHKKFIYIKR